MEPAFIISKESKKIEVSATAPFISVDDPLLPFLPLCQYVPSPPYYMQEKGSSKRSIAAKDREVRIILPLIKSE
jgi:hypothetical protein